MDFCKSDDERQYILSYSTLHKLCSDELMDCKYQITQLATQVDHNFATLDQSDPKHSKRGIIHSLWNFYLETQIVSNK